MTTQFSHDKWGYPPDDLTDEEVADIEREKRDAAEFAWEEIQNKENQHGS